jgi:hypothetical protein
MPATLFGSPQKTKKFGHTTGLVESTRFRGFS